MKSFKFSVFVLVALFAADAMAQATTTSTQTTFTLDADGDGHGSNDSNAPTLDAATRPAGYAENVDDCDDSNPQVHPGAKELLDDDVDNDCDGDQAVSPPPGVLRAFGCSPSNPDRVLRTIKEIAICSASVNCKVNMTAGTFKTSPGFYWMVTKCGGVHHVVDQDEKDRVDDLHARGAFCPRSKTAPARRHGGSGKGHKPAPKQPDPKVTAIEGQLTTLADGVTGVTGRVANVETLLVKVDEAMVGVNTTLGAHDKRLGKLETRADETDAALTEVREQSADTDTLARQAGETAERAAASASTALSTGVSAGVSVGYLGKSSERVTFQGKTLRGTTSGSLMFQGHFGAELPGMYVLGVAGIGVKLHEESPDGMGLLFKGGGELLFKLPNPAHALGFGVGYIGDLSGGDIVAAAESRGGYLEAIYQLSPGDGEGSTQVNALRISLGAGYEALGTRGRDETPDSEFKADHQAPFFLFSVSTGIAVGAHRR